MAEIVNKKQPINPSVWENTNSDESKKRHDLYNHVSVDKLYGYNPAIMEIDEYGDADLYLETTDFKRYRLVLLNAGKRVGGIIDFETGETVFVFLP